MVNETTLAWGYNPGLPPGCTVAWGCRAIVTQDGAVDMLPDRQSLMGSDADKARLTAHLNEVGMAPWKNAAARLLQLGEMRTREASEHILFDDGTVRIVGNTLASHGYLYVAAYFTQN